ncbi:MAG: CubicO group peptidase (beta-lactamase class C family) [Bacteroidia bacterium]|jgi:CubicO group peptidase (beta-lactamase class C family)
MRRINSQLKLYCLTACVFLQTNVLSAVPTALDSLTDTVAIKEWLGLIKNSDDLIPLERLDTLKILSIELQGFGNDFHRRVNSYKESNNYTGNDFENLMSIPANLIIAGMDLRTAADSVMVQNFYNHIKKLKQQRSEVKVILIAYYPLELFEPEGEELRNLFSSIIFIPTHIVMRADDAFDKAVQAVFGGISIRKFQDVWVEKMPAQIHYAKSDPVTLKTRLEYRIFEEVGIPSFQLDKGISEIVNEAIDSMAFPGCQILVAKDSKVIFHKSYGYHTYAEKRQVLNTDIYDLASISKVTGATTSLMALHDQEKINLDDKFSTYWPLFDNTNKEELSLRDVLAHNARLKSWIPYYLKSRKKNGKYKARTVKGDSSRRFPQRLSSSHFLHKDYKEKKIYKWINKTPLNEEPGYVYSGLSFYLYPEIVANLTGESYDGFLYNQFFKPLGATTLSFNPARKFDLERIVPTETDDYFRMEQIHGEVHDEGAIMMEGVSGNAGLFSNANDLAKVWQMYLNGGYYGGTQFISEETLNEFTKCQFCETGNRRGLGFDKPLVVYDSLKSSVAKQASPESFGHSGYTGAFVWADPQNQLLYIFLSNRVYPTRDNRKIYTMNVRPRIHTLIYELLGNTE